MGSLQDRLHALFPNMPSRIGGARGIADVFWPLRDSSLLRVSSSGRPPPGFRVAESYALIPSAANPRYLLPLSPRPAVARSVGQYNSLRTGRRRAIRVVGAAGLRAGLVQPLLRDRMYVHVRLDASNEELARVSLMHRLAQLLGGERVAGFVSLGGGGPYAKPVIQLVSWTGEPLAFVKIGWDDVTGRLVVNEARALRLCERASFRAVRVPGLIHAERWNDLELSIASPLPQRVRRYPPRLLPPIAITEEVCEMGDGGPRVSLWESAYASDLRSRLRKGAAPGGRRGSPRTPDLVEWLRARSPEASVRIGAWHGDWVPWNLAVRGSEIHAWDWEHSSDRVPLGFDVIHFYFQTAFIQDRLGLEASIQRAKASSQAPLQRLGIPERLAPTLLGLHLLEMSLRVDELLQLGGEPNPRLYPGIHEILRRPDRVIS